jgi:hypothetical protein
VLVSPLVLEQSEVDLIAPRTPEPLVAEQMRFSAHPETRGESKRCVVAAVDSCDHAMEPKLVKREVHDGVGRLGGIAQRRCANKAPAWWQPPYT